MSLPEDLEIVLETPPDPEDQRLIVEGLIAFNRAMVPPMPYTPMTFMVREPSGRKLGGIDGWISFGWMFVKNFWLPEDLRGHGLGRQLMAAAEREARRQGCVGIHLDTFDFQARGFYEKLGFEVFAELADFPPPGHRRFFLKKMLRAEAT
ncbi:MAG: GNAT family N-acetyltransferase [Alphaproteobacteria bacterium]|nr:GNAT family N-acetyltransferase [Alphaproteobacteria bacterium]MCW5751479.1 GNAT family N-acetyltransferase [Alphaproteobacteria bacterium]